MGQAAKRQDQIGILRSLRPRSCGPMLQLQEQQQYNGSPEKKAVGAGGAGCGGVPAICSLETLKAL